MGGYVVLSSLPEGSGPQLHWRFDAKDRFEAIREVTAFLVYQGETARKVEGVMAVDDILAIDALRDGTSEFDKIHLIRHGCLPDSVPYESG